MRIGQDRPDQQPHEHLPSMGSGLAGKTTIKV